MNERPLTRLEKQGLIQGFEYTHELAWKTLKDFLENRGNAEIYGSKDAVKESFKVGLIENGELWMEMIKSRNQTSHTYDESAADEIIKLICKKYFPEFKKIISTMERLQIEERKS